MDVKTTVDFSEQHVQLGGRLAFTEPESTQVPAPNISHPSINENAQPGMPGVAFVPVMAANQYGIPMQEGVPTNVFYSTQGPPPGYPYGFPQEPPPQYPYIINPPPPVPDQCYAIANQERIHRMSRSSCGCHVTTCCYIIGILESISLIISLIGSIVRYNANDNGQYSTFFYDNIISAIVAFVIGVIVIPLMFFGISKTKAGLLLPHLVVQGIGIAAFALGFILFCMAGDIYQIIIVVIGFLFETFFMIQVVKCYGYLKVKARMM